MPLKVKKQGKKKPSSKQKGTREPQLPPQQSLKPTQKKTPSKPFAIPPLDTEGSSEDEKQAPERSEQYVPTTKHIQGLAFDIDKNDSGGWKVVGDKKSKRSHTETSLTSTEGEETSRASAKPKNKETRRKKPINKVPGMTD